MHKPWFSAVCVALALPAAALAQASPRQAAAGKVGAIAAAAPRTQATCDNFGVLTCGQTVSGSLDPSDCTLADGTPVDYYQFAGSGGEAVTATLTSSAFSPLVELINPSGSAKTSNYSTVPGTTQAQLSLDAQGTWSIAAATFDATPTYGPYTLTLTCGSTAPTCIPNDTTLCLDGGRFSVQAAFDAGGGNAGQAQAVQLTTDTGYLWFFAASNVEAVVKVLDGCALNSNFWVFAGGLTNVAVTLTVTDTKTGTVKTYQNPANTTFEPIQDTSAFATCP